MNQSTSPAEKATQARPDHIVVAIPHLSAVQTELQRLDETGVKSNVRDRNALLDLAVLDLPNLASDAERLRDDPGVCTGVARLLHIRKSDCRRLSQLDLLMSALRVRFGDKYHGWMPTIGKNRAVEGIQGFPEIVGGGKGYPERARAGSLRFAPPVSGLRRPVRVGVVDTRIYPHPLLHGAYYAPEDCILDGRPPMPQYAGHATFVAGVILQQAAVELHLRSALHDATARATAWDVACRMAEFAGSGIDILNLSFGCRVDDGEGPLVLSRAVELLCHEMVIVAAAGNHPAGEGAEPSAPRNTPTFPAAFSDVVAVGAADPSGEPAAFNPNGPWLDLLALGVDVRSTYLKGNVLVHHDTERPERAEIARFSGYATWSGTSFAAAMATGEIAAGTQPGRKSAREVVDEMLDADAAPAGHGARRYPPPA